MPEGVIRSVSKLGTNKKNWLETVSPKFNVAKWESPLADAKDLYFEGMITFEETHFYFTDKAGNTYVITIPRLSPVRFVGESELMAAYCPIQDKAEELGIPMRLTWKVWNSKFIEEVNYGDALFWDAPEEDKFQYFIASDDECVEFMSGKVEIEVFKGEHFIEIAKRDFAKEASLFKTKPETK